MNIISEDIRTNKQKIHAETLENPLKTSNGFKANSQ